MKKRIQYLFLFFIVFGFYACEDGLFDTKDDETTVPVFSVNTPQAILTPTDASTYVFTSDQMDMPFELISWSAALLNPSNLQDPFYRLQMDFAGQNFANPTLLASSSELSHEMTIGALNAQLVGLSGLVGTDTTVNVELRVIANIENTAVDTIYSNVIGMSITLYNTVVNVDVQPIYMLGSATIAGWDNALALEMAPLPDGQFEIYADLTSAEEIKFISKLGNWAPQWGTDGSGTWESGPLVYRPNEAAPDPMGIPSPDVDGPYRIVADTVLLTYKVTPVDLVYLLGSATVAGWDNTLAVPFGVVSEGVFTTIADLTGGAEWKIIDELGAWAPQWGTDGTGDWESGTLSYRPTEDEPDPAGIPSPPDAGTYRLDINLTELTYEVTPQ